MYPMIREIGGVRLQPQFVERQNGPECGFEAVENVIQLFYPASNGISESDLKPWARINRLVVQASDGMRLSTHGYAPALRRWGIEADWYPFDRGVLAHSLRQNRVAIAVVDGYQLDPRAYPMPRSWHAVVITNFVSTSAPNIPILAYVGVDSNFPGSPRRWDAKRMAEAIKAFSPRGLLVTRAAVAHAYQSNYEILVRYPDGRFGVRVSATQ